MDNKLIGVTGSIKKFKHAWWSTRFILNHFGMKSCYLTSQNPYPESPIHGLVIGGGNDIDPTHYGEKKNSLRLYDIERDRFEIRLAEHCIAEGIPVLGICRGAQLINILMGGSLFADITDMREFSCKYQTGLPIKRVKIIRSSRIYECLKVTKLYVNNLHRQAVKRLGNGLKIMALDQDGIIQGIESNHQFLMGVQWHPEYLPYLSNQRKIFQCFVEATTKSTQKLEPKLLKSLILEDKFRQNQWNQSVFR